MAAAVSHSELRVLVLDGMGHSSTVCAILGLQDPQKSTPGPGGPQCRRHSGELLGKKVAVVSSPAWFGSWCTPEDRRKLIASFITLCNPGPHVFLLCVPVTQAANGETRALDVLEKLFGSSAVSSNTIVLFTHTEELEEDEQLEEYLITWRKDLVKLLERCGERYQTLETGKGEEDDRRAVKELLEKMEQVVENTGNKHFSCSLLQEAEELLRNRPRKRDVLNEDEEDVSEEEMEAVRDLDNIIDSIFPSESVSSSPTAPSFIWRVWGMLSGWVKSLPLLVRREALLGALVGFFVGGPYGGIVGASIGSVATEVKRRKLQKIK